MGRQPGNGWLYENLYTNLFLCTTNKEKTKPLSAVFITFAILFEQNQERI